MTPPETKPSLHELAESAYEKASPVLSEQQLDMCYRRMAESIKTELAGANPVIISVMLGGMVPTVRITEQLEFAFELDYLHATRYANTIQGGHLSWKVSPQTDLARRHVLVIDDIVDEGHTLAAIQSTLRAQSVASLTTATLLDKQHDRRVPEVSVDIVGAQVADNYVFGGGMDYCGYFRQLRSIWALATNTNT